MPPADENGQRLECSDSPLEGDLSFQEQELLAKTREIAQRITERVRMVLEDTDTHRALPTEEKPPPA
jgi:hypothetical protein